MGRLYKLEAVTALALLLLLATSPARAEDAPAKASAARLGSLKALLKSADAMAAQWSAGAKLYSALGTAPGNRERWEPETWELFYGDPETKDGMFHAVFSDGNLTGRSGVKDGVSMVEQYADGKLVNKQAGEVEWETNDYSDCLPLERPFIDTLELDAKMREIPVTPDELGRFRIALLRSKNDHCDGLGHISLFLSEKPIPKKMRAKTLWIVTGPQETVFFAASTGEALLRRLLKAPEPPAAQEAGRKAHIKPLKRR